MESLIHEIEVADKKYTCLKLNAFDAFRHLMAIKSLIPAGALSAGLSSEGVIDALSGINQDTLNQVVFPLLKDCKLRYAQDGCEAVMICDAMSMNRCFTADTLMDFFLVVFEVLKLNFTPFFQQLLNRVGTVNL